MPIHASIRASQKIRHYTFSAQLQLLPMNPRYSSQPVSPLCFEIALCTHPYPLLCLQVFTACSATQIHRYCPSSHLQSAIPYFRMLSTSTYNTSLRTEYTATMLPEISQFVFFSVTEYQHSQHRNSSKGRHCSTGHKMYVAQLIFSFYESLKDNI